MSEMQYRRRRQAKLARLEIVSQLYLRQYSVRQIRAEVMRRLDLKTYSLDTVHGDIQTILKELREFRLDNTEQAVQLELERIDETCRELWKQWEKSKEDYVRQTKRKRGVISSGNSTNITNVDTTENNVVGLGNPAYISEIRAQQQERRKLLGLYAAVKTEVTGKDGKDLIPSISVEIIDSRDKVAEVDRDDAEDTDN